MEGPRCRADRPSPRGPEGDGHVRTVGSSALRTRRRVRCDRVAGVLVLPTAERVSAAVVTITVTATSDDYTVNGNCTLREAVDAVQQERRRSAHALRAARRTRSSWLRAHTR